MIAHIKNLRRLRRDTTGVVAVETGMVMAFFLVPSLLCLLDFAALYQSQATVEEATENAMTYVMNAGAGASSAAVQSAAQASSTQSISATATTACFCVPITSGTPTLPRTVQCGSSSSNSCTGSEVFQQFMSISTSSDVDIPFPVPWINLTSPHTVTARGMVRTG